MNIVQQFDIPAEFVAQVFEQFWNGSHILHFPRKRPSAAFSEMVNEVVNTVYQAASVIRRSAKVMIFRGSHQALVKVENSFCIIVCRNALRRFGMEEPFFVETTFFLPEDRPTGRFSESAGKTINVGICSAKARNFRGAKGDYAGN